MRQNKSWAQTKCPSTGKQINKLWHIHTMECYSTIKKAIIDWYPHNMDKSPKKETRHERVDSVWFHSYENLGQAKVSLMEKNRTAIACCGRGAWWDRSMRELHGLMVKFPILIRIWVTQVCAFIRTHQINGMLEACAFHCMQALPQTGKITEPQGPAEWRDG